jgi:hypothetical protein
MPSKALEMGFCFHKGPVLRNIWGRSFPRAFERRMKFLVPEEFYEKFERLVKEISVNGQLSISPPPPSGEPGGVWFTGTF